VNVDEEPEAASRWGVYAIPATLLFVDGEEKGRVMGVADRHALVNLLRPYLT